MRRGERLKHGMQHGIQLGRTLEVVTKAVYKAFQLIVETTETSRFKERTEETHIVQPR